MKPANREFFRTTPEVFSYKRCVFIVGAGISVPSGIPDFRSPAGIFSTLRKQLKIDGASLFTYNFGMKENTRKIYLKYISELKTLCDSSSPNEMHSLLASFPRSRIYTQNIDGLEERAGLKFTKESTTHGVYLHGNLSKLVCQYCGYKEPFEQQAVASFSSGSEIECKRCLERAGQELQQGKRKRPVGTMRPGIIHYHQAHPDEAFIGRMVEKDRNCDMLVVVGTSLKVDGVKRLVKLFARSPLVAGKRVLVNDRAIGKQWEGVFDYFFEGDCIDFVREYTEARRQWMDSCSAPARLSNDQILQKLKEMQNRKSKKMVVLDSQPPDNILVPLRRLSLLADDDSTKCLGDTVKESATEDTEPPQQLLCKLAKISDMFDSSDLIAQPILDDALKSALPAKIKRSSLSDAEYVANHAGSSVVSFETNPKNKELKSTQMSPAPKKRAKGI